MEALGYLNPTDTGLEEVISSQDRTHRLAVTAMYELPFGRGKLLRGPSNAFVSKMISGWQVQGIYTAQSGAALGFGNAIFLGDLQNIPLPKDQRNVDRWFNIDAGFERNTAQQLGVEHPDVAVALLRRPRRRPEQLGHFLHQEHAIKEGKQLQFRAEAINALNHPQFTAPNTTSTSTAFGTVTGEFAWPRVIQFGLKLLF